MLNFLRLWLRYSKQQQSIHFMNTYKVVSCKHVPYLNFIARKYHNDLIDEQDRTLKYFFKKIEKDIRKRGHIFSEDLEEILVKIKQTCNINDKQALKILNYSQNLMIEETPFKKTELTMEIWKIFHKLGVNLNIEHYNYFLKVLLDNEYPFSPLNVLKELDSYDLKPTQLTYELLVKGYCQVGEIDGANAILKFMKEQNIKANNSIFNALILCYAKMSDMINAEQIIDMMIEAESFPDSETFVNLMHGYLKQKNLCKFFELYEKYRVKFNDNDYLRVVYDLINYGYIDKVDKILNSIVKSINYNITLKTYVVKLMNENKIDMAFKLLKTFSRTSSVDGTCNSVGDFFIEHLVRCDIPVEHTVNYCYELMKDNLNPLALSNAMLYSLRFQKENTALALFKIATEKNVPLRPHYFWPLLVNRGQKKDIKGMFDLLNIMNRKFDVVPNAITVRDYVVPFALKEYSHIEPLLQDLKSSGVSMSIIISSVVLNLLNENRLRKAAEVASNYNVFYPPNLIRKSLVTNFVQTNDILSFVTLLKQINAGLLRKHNDVEDIVKNEDENYEVPERHEYIGQIVNNVISIMKRRPNAVEEIEDLLSKLLNSGIGIGPRSADSIQNILKRKFTARIPELLKKITDNMIMVEKLSDEKVNARNYTNSLDVNTLEQLNNSMNKNEEFAGSIKRQLFIMYCRNQDVDKLLKLKEELEKDENFVITNAMYAFLIDLCVENGKHDEAISIFDMVRDKKLDFNLTLPKLLKLTSVLVKNGQCEKAYELLDCDHVRVNDPNKVFLCWGLLNELAIKGDVKNLQKFFTLFVTRDMVPVNNILLGPLIKVYLTRDDKENAINQFETLSFKYGVTPCKFELLRYFIEQNDDGKLQKIIDISSKIHGKMNTLFDLVILYVECDHLEKAVKLIKDSNLNIRTDRLQNICAKYRKDESVKHLKNLFNVLRSVNSTNRSVVCHNLLLLYDKQNDVKGALELYESIQNEVISPDYSFLTLLNKILERNGVNLPVAAVKSDVKINDKNLLSKNQTSKLQRKTLKIDEEEELVKGNTLANNQNRSKQNENKFQTINKSNMYDTNVKELMQSMRKTLAQKNLPSARKVINKLLLAGVLPHHNDLKFYISLLMRAGQVEEIEKLKDFLSKNMRKLIKFDNMLCKAYSNANREKEYFAKLEDRLDSIKNEIDMESYLENFPKGGIIALMSSKRSLAPLVKGILEKIITKTDKFIIAPNLLWMHYMISENFDEAEKIFERYLQYCNKALTFKKLTALAMEKSNIQLAEKILNMLKTKPDITDSNLGHCYATVIGIYLKLGNTEKAFNLLQEALQKLSTEHIDETILETLKEACINNGISFEYENSIKSSKV